MLRKFLFDGGFATGLVIGLGLAVFLLISLFGVNYCPQDPCPVEGLPGKMEENISGLMRDLWRGFGLINRFEGFFAELITTALSVFLGVWLSIRFALKRFITEKWWERRVQAYEDVIAAVYSGFKEFDELLHAEAQDIEIPSDLKEKLRKESAAADKAIAHARIIGGLKLSQTFLDRIKRLDKELSCAGEDPEEGRVWQLYLTDAHDAYSTCLRDMQNIARQDLSI